MRIVFMGTPEFAVPSLTSLFDHGYDLVAVVTAPDKPRGRGQQVSFTPIKEFALQHHVPLLQPESLKDPQFVSALAQSKPDLIVVVAFRILPREVYTIPALGSFNLHASLLPKYRGAAPINWAIINGETETGVTTFFLQDKVDTGSLILQARVKIGPDETAGELHDKLSEVGAEIVFQTVRLIELGKAKPRLQDDALATPAPKIFRDDCRIDWNKPSYRIHNLVRGMSPYPCAWTMHQERVIKLYRTKLVQEESGAVHIRAAGEVVHVDTSSLIVQTADGLLSLVDIQQEGKRRLGIEEFLRGYRVKVGDRFE